MRIRSTKPEFWRSPDTARLSYFARLLFMGLWNYVDDNGVGEYDEALIRSDLFPRDPVDEVSVMIHGAIIELYGMAQIILFESVETGRQYLQVANWHHQKINRPTKSQKPTATSANIRLIEPSVSDPGVITEDSLPDQGIKGSREPGIEGSGDQGTSTSLALVEGGPGGDPVTTAPAKAVAKTKRGTRIADDYMPSDETIAKIRAEFPSISKDDLIREHRKFCDHWQAKTGANGTKLDWDATWRNWMRTAYERGNIGRSGPAAQPSKVDAKAAGWSELGRQISEREAANG